ncbi:MAG TPA: nuclear transport factor 2 family protein [Chitinophaga sp.]|uniref:nuclear transport factor 2 family protein n=1 Tax=Chitinophaga sp. TaxID=1869181 RepID=UPI002BBC9906|nr:nuclear transport factor 2 family protein [Chitinophaga sp.]HVI49565.1 nuclear transport factor 2 family protein [Chitinophaga sp.]
MRNYSFLLLLAVCGACVQPGGKISLANPNTMVVRELYDAFNDHNWTKMADCYKDTAIFLDPSFGLVPVTQTRQQTIEKYTALQKMFPDVRDSVVSIYGEKNHITVEFISSGTSADGKKWQLPICSVFTIEDGKIARDNTYYDQQ